MCIFVKLAPKQVRTFCLKEKPAPAIGSAGLCARCGIEGIADLSHVLHETPGEYIYTDAIENEYFRIEMSRPCGVTRIYDKKKRKELLREGETAFRPVYEVTPRDLTEDYLWVRRNMGRNRKAVRTRRDFGELIDIKVLENGTLYGRVELKYRLEGTQECSVILTAHKLMPRITVDLRLHKDSVWEPCRLRRTGIRSTWIRRARYSVRESTSCPVPAWIFTRCKTERRLRERTERLFLRRRMRL